MELSKGLHLAYCTNIHRGEDWAQTFKSLKTDVMSVRDRVSKNNAYAIGLRLSDLASRELSHPAVLETFQQSYFATLPLLADLQIVAKLLG